MSLSIGIIGLPNVGKSTLFNAITNAGAEAQNYPFCTIEPNTGIVPIPDERLLTLSKISNTQKIIHAIIEFVDIAGLVKGASQGEGLGNQFLSNIREVSAIAHVVRCFEDDNIVHVHGEINPISDIEIVNTELILADLESIEKMIQNTHKKARNDKDLASRLKLLERIQETLAKGNPAKNLDFSEDDQEHLKTIQLLSTKKVIYIANISEDTISQSNEYTKAVSQYAKDHNDEFTVISAKIEEEISELDASEKATYLEELGLKQSGLDLIAKTCFQLLRLQTYLTTGEKETRAWTILKGSTAPQAAGVIHTDFERGFIRANIVSYQDFVELEGLKGCKEKGLMRQEGKEYIMQDGDIVEFLFNV
jgi:GTP-binding protein YchF